MPDYDDLQSGDIPKESCSHTNNALLENTASFGDNIALGVINISTGVIFGILPGIVIWLLEQHYGPGMEASPQAARCQVIGNSIYHIVTAIPPVYATFIVFSYGWDKDAT